MNFLFLKFPAVRIILLLSAILFVSSCKAPEEELVLRKIKDIVVDASSEPKLKAQAVLYNPNRHHGKLKHIKMDIFVDGKKAGTIDQKMKIDIPGKKEFTVPLEVKLVTKEFGFLNTLLSVIGGKKFDVNYKGTIRVSYHGLPLRVPLDYKDEVMLSF
jgi:LEA14-like dessication related protein